MDPFRQNSINVVWNLHVVITNLCRFMNTSDLLALRLVNQVSNYAALLFMKQNGHRPTIHLRTDDEVRDFVNLMSKRTNDELPMFCSFGLALATLTMEGVKQFVTSSCHLYECEFYLVQPSCTWHRGAGWRQEVIDASIRTRQVCDKMAQVLKKGSTQLQKISIGCKRDIHVDQTQLDQLPETFPNLRDVKVHYLSDGFQTTCDMVSTIVSRAPRLHTLEVSNGVHNRWHVSALLLRRLVRILSRPDPPFLRLRIQLMLQDDIESLEALMSVSKFNRLRFFEFLLIFEDVNQNDGGNLLARFSEFLKFQAPALQELSIVTAGNEVTHPLQLPELPNLKILEIASVINFRKNAIQRLTPNQFPNLETLEITGHNLYKHLVGTTVLPSVKSLLLDLEISNVSPAEDAASTDSIHINFPNLILLELRDSAYMNLKRVGYVLNYLDNLEVLILNTHMTLKHRGGNTFWKVFAGKQRRLPKRKILKLCQRQPRVPVVREERDAENTNSFNRLPSLGNLPKLRILEISVSLATQLGALAYMARPECMHPLQKLYLGFTHGNSIDPDDQNDYVRMLRRFHDEVNVEELSPRRGIRI